MIDEKHLFDSFVSLGEIDPSEKVKNLKIETQKISCEMVQGTIGQAAVQALKREGFDHHGNCLAVVLGGNLQSYWTSKKLWKLTVVLD